MKHILIIAFSVIVSSTSYAGNMNGEREFDNVRTNSRDLSSEKIEQDKETKKAESTEKEEKVEKRRPPYHEGNLNSR